MLALLALVLLGLGTSWAAPALTQVNHHLRNTDPPRGCLVWIWNVWNLCVVAPPISTIGPSTRRDNTETFAIMPATNPILEGCLILVPDVWQLCVVAPPTSTVGPSMRHEAIADPDANTPTPTSIGDCVVEIWEQYNICIVGPPTSTIGPSSKKERRDWHGIGQPTTGDIIPDKTVPGGNLIPDDYVPGGSITTST